MRSVTILRYSQFQSNKRNYWKSVAVIRKKNYNTVLVIDNTRSHAAIVDILKKLNTLHYIIVFLVLAMLVLQFNEGTTLENTR